MCRYDDWIRLTVVESGLAKLAEPAAGGPSRIPQIRTVTVVEWRSRSRTSP